MKQEIVLSGAFANCKDNASSEDLLAFLQKQTEGVDYYRFIPTPGVVYDTALDWQAILSNTASIITIAGILWQVYIKRVKPLRDKGKENAFLYISLENADGDRTQFTLGREFDNEAEFVTEFTYQVEKIRIAPDGEVEIEKQKIELAECWRKI